MLKNKSLQVRMVDATNPPGVILEKSSIDAEQINRILKEQVQNAAITFGAVMIARRIVDTVCTISIIAANVKIQ